MPIDDMVIDTDNNAQGEKEWKGMTLYVWECKCCGTRYIEGFSRVSNPYIGMEIKIPCPYMCKIRPGITNESVMVLKEIKRRKGGERL